MKNFFTGRVVKEAAQWSGGITVPESVKKMCRCGAWGHLWGLMVGRREIAGVFVSNLNNSMILWITRSVSHLHKENHNTEENSVQHSLGKPLCKEERSRKIPENLNPWHFNPNSSAPQQSFGRDKWFICEQSGHWRLMWGQNILKAATETSCTGHLKWQFYLPGNGARMVSAPCVRSLFPIRQR